MFHPSWPWRGPHVQSVLAGLPPRRWSARRRAAELCRESVETLLDCGGGVTLQAFHTAGRTIGAAANAARPAPLAVLLHGWEGSAESAHVLSLAATLYEAGFGIVRLNLRDHGHTHHLNRDLFHSCRLPELMGALQAIAHRQPGARIYLAGFSLGGNFMLRAAADSRLAGSVVGAAAVSPVLDPAVTLLALENGSPIYRRHFVHRWSRSLRAKQRAWPGDHDFKALLRLRDLRAMTDELVRRCTDFPHLDAYLAGYALTGERLGSLRIPACLLLAADDPLIPSTDLPRLAASPQLRVAHTPHGGHCGFLESWSGPSFADRFVSAHFRELERRAATPSRVPVATAAQGTAHGIVSSAGGNGS